MADTDLNAAGASPRRSEAVSGATFGDRTERIPGLAERSDTEIERREIDGNRKLLDDKCCHHFRLWPCVCICCADMIGYQ